MLLQSLREEVLEANLELSRRGLAIYTFGNASGIDRASGLVVIKPSGVPYETMKASDLPVIDLSGKAVEGDMKPSSDLDTHLALYRAFHEIGGVVHVHSRVATAWAQARKPIPCFGTTHADYFRGAVPVSDELTPEQIARDYEAETGLAIVRTFDGRDPLEVPAVLVASHGPFCWGRDASEAVHNAAILEEVAAMAHISISLDPSLPAISRDLLDKHFCRKHGAKAYYGQANRS